MVKTIDITYLMHSSLINHAGSVEVDDNTSGLEPNPQNDWLHFAIESYKKAALENPNIRSAAFIGSGNGIETIAAIKIFNSLEELFVTDVLADVLPQTEQNIRANVGTGLEGKTVRFIAGRDCLPLEKKVDLIYGNLPLIAVDANELDKLRATTTLTEASAYAHLSRGQEDSLRKYSFLSQLGFLLSAKEKLNEDGLIITLLGGRVPYEIIQKCFERAGLQHRVLLSGFKKQSDPEFLREYSAYEGREGIQFAFYDFEKGCRLLNEAGIKAPGGFRSYTDAQLREILNPVQINAAKAYSLTVSGRDVGHIAYAFEAWS